MQALFANEASSAAAAAAKKIVLLVKKYSNTGLFGRYLS
jgi:hypothetical protein